MTVPPRLPRLLSLSSNFEERWISHSFSKVTTQNTSDSNRARELIVFTGEADD